MEEGDALEEDQLAVVFRKSYCLVPCCSDLLIDGQLSFELAWQAIPLDWVASLLELKHMTI